jgi:protoheme IX farnesyltransferase
MFEFTNDISGILSVASIALYALIYTPLKRLTSFSVFVGAIPGALPTLIGAVAGEEGFGKIGMFPFLLIYYTILLAIPSFLGDSLG